jgi:hypothetical protein
MYKVVSVLSATHLLCGLAVVGGIYVAILAGMYVRALRAVRRASSEQRGESGSLSLVEGVDEVLLSEVLVPLISPFRDRLERLAALEKRLDDSVAGSPRAA